MQSSATFGEVLQQLPTHARLPELLEVIRYSYDRFFPGVGREKLGN